MSTQNTHTQIDDSDLSLLRILSLKDATGSLWDEVRAAQIADSSRFSLLRMIGMLVAVAFAGVIFHDAISPLLLGGWAIIAALASANMHRVQKQQQSDYSRGAPITAMRRDAMNGLVLGLIWSLPALLFVPSAGLGYGFEFWVLSATMMVGVTAITAATPAACFAFILLLGTANAVMAFRLGYPSLY